jgi:putative acetyltransferase
LVIRSATTADHAAIRAVVAAAFERDDEARMVDEARAAGAALVELVAEEDGEIVGHVRFNRMTAPPGRRIAGLAPLSVRPDRQRRGIGEALTRAGLEALRALGAEACVVLGHPDYYPRFGFSTAAAARVISPYAASPAFMALELTPGALTEAVELGYPAAFG